MRYGKENKQTNKKVLGSFQSSMLVISKGNKTNQSRNQVSKLIY